jgi:hypothetical protein
MSLRQEVAVRTWKIVLACAALSAASIFALAHNGSNSVVGGRTTSLTAQQTRSQQSTSAEKAAVGAKSDTEYGWGPFRTTDW